MRRNGEIRGFALPTVLIASVVMLIVLAVSVTSVVAVRTALKTQYYEQLAKTAGEAGVAYAKACLAKSGNIPTWTDAKPLTPSSDCTGTQRLEPAVQVLIVAGGGGGAATGSGGGAGGVLQLNSLAISVGTYPVVVGGGGAGGITSGPTKGSKGGNSSFASNIAEGGGGGYTHGYNGAGEAGGSGGGGPILTSGTTWPGGVGSQGNNGGQGVVAASWAATAGGGGGGAGGPGFSGGNSGTAGNGGLGITTTIGGPIEHLAGGGGAGEVNGAVIGVGGAGDTKYGAGSGVMETTGTAARVNSGSGGGGGSFIGGAYFNGGAGGSGLVIIKYPANGSITATGGTKTDDGVNVIHRFTSGTVNFQVTAATTSSCPLDDRCTVAIQGNARSSFRVGLPTVDSSGKALAIPNNGYVELLRSSNGSVWRTYSQPSVQAAVVPDLCSGGNTASATGWANAVRTTTQSPVPAAPAAETISLSTSPLAAGKVYYRKDFSIPAAGTYNLTYTGIAAQDSIQVYLNSTLLGSGDGSALRNASASLSPGCYNLTFVVDNISLASRESGITATLRSNEGNPVVVSDTSWRVASGGLAHFSSPDFYANPALWSAVTDQGAAVQAASIGGTWHSITADPFTRWIVTSHSNSGGNYPSAQFAFYRDYKDVVVTANTQVRVAAACDDNCVVYLDGQPIITGAQWATIAQQTITLTPGVHRFGIRHYNGAGGAGVAMTVVRLSDNATLTRTDNRWLAASSWSIYADELYSYEKSFDSTQNSIAKIPTFDALVVAGGGGGTQNAAGGGGGGGVRFFEDIVATTGSKAITVGGGGAGAGGNARGASGGLSQYLSTTYRSLGGGAGAPRTSTAGLTPLTGGSGGGGAGGVYANNVGAAGTAGYGSAGGTGTAPDAGCGSRGGGGGGATGTGNWTASGGVGGWGGSGYMTYITGSLMVFGSGGGGSVTCGGTNGGADSGGGVTSVVPPANRGGGGGSGPDTTPGTAGGSGIVIIRYKTGTLTATGGTITTWNGYTIHTFTATGTFNVTTLTP